MKFLCRKVAPLPFIDYFFLDFTRADLRILGTKHKIQRLFKDFLIYSTIQAYWLHGYMVPGELRAFQIEQVRNVRNPVIIVKALRKNKRYIRIGIIIKLHMPTYAFVIPRSSSFFFYNAPILCSLALSAMRLSP